MDIFGDAQGNIFVTDQIPRLSMMSSEGRLIGRCRPVRFGAHGIGGDADGNLYLAETAPLDSFWSSRRGSPPPGGRIASSLEATHTKRDCDLLPLLPL